MRRETEEWLKLANEDLQSAEKVLKSLLAEREVEVPRIHNLLDLNNFAKQLGYATNLSEEDAIFLNTVYRWRYPPDLGLLPSGAPTELDA